MTVLIGDPLAGKTGRLIEAFRGNTENGYHPDNILCLSFFPANVAAIRLKLRGSAADFFPWITTLQRFQTLLLRGYPRQARLPRRTREISPTARNLLLRQAWQSVGGPLWSEFGETPGAVGELVRVVDWISQSRTRFLMASNELSDHELARVYRVYFDLCDRNRLLTFQEASLRCLDLLADPDVAADIQKRFPVVLVDDLHLARPDQLALIERLHGLAKHFVATAWLTDDGEYAAPELRHVVEAVNRWGSIEPLTPGVGVNPAILEVAGRLNSAPGTDNREVGGASIRLHTAFTVENEAHAAAQAIVRALVDDATLRPLDVVVVAADQSLLPFVQRVLGEYGLPVAAPSPKVRRTLLIMGGLLVLRRALLGPDVNLDRELLALPYLALDRVDLHILINEADTLGQPILGLAPDVLQRLQLRAETLQHLEVARQVFDSLDNTRRLPDLVEQALAGLGAFAWLRNSTDAGDGAFSALERQAWERAYLDWADRLRELEAVAAIGAERPADPLGLAEALADEINVPATPDGVQLIEPGRANGIHARLAFVVGLSENAAPVLRPEMQLLAESELPSLFADGRPVVLPQARRHVAWIEREARSLAELLTRGTQQLWLSTSRYTAAGEAQLPSPFFERLLGADGDIDRDGRLVITRPGLWQMVEGAQMAGPEHLLPALGLGQAGGLVSDPGIRLLTDHTFSASQIRLYLTCPLQFFYARVLGIETEGGLALDRGSLIHAVLCATLGDGRVQKVNLQDRPRPIWMNAVKTLQKRAMVVLDAAWSGQPADLPGGERYQPEMAWGERFGPDLQQQAVRRWAEAIVDDWAEYEVEGWPDALERRPVLLEATFFFELGGYKITGRLDRVDEIQTPTGISYEIVDYKTSRAGKESLAKQIARFLPAEGTQPSDYQLPLYALAVANGLQGIQGMPGRLSLLNVDGLEKKKNGQYTAGACRTITLGAGGSLDTKTGYVPVTALTEDVSRGLEATLGRMAASPYPPQPGFHCGWCSFRTACERGQGQVAAA